MLPFRTEVIAEASGRTAIGDLDGDGLNDIVLHTWSSNRGLDNDGSITWLRAPSWDRQIILGEGHLFGDGVVAVDLDADGDQDVVAAKGDDGLADIYWYENRGPDAEWTEHHVAIAERGSEAKDLEAHDFDGDGTLDLLVRTKHFLVVYYQQPTESGEVRWVENRMANRQREGMASADLDGDGDFDAVMNGFWRENPGQDRTASWPEHDIDPQWFQDVTGGWQDHSVMVDAGDIDGDGRTDVVMGHSEKTGYQVTWYACESPREGPEAWVDHPIAVVDYCHSMRLADFDKDGDLDVLAATLIRTDTPKVVVFWNNGSGQEWSEQVLAETSAYKANVGDLDGDGDDDIVTARSWEETPIRAFFNPYTANGDNQK
ncbi:MAG: VCBS repeat-containing protein [Planctomycetota bacterium]